MQVPLLQLRPRLQCQIVSGLRPQAPLLGFAARTSLRRQLVLPVSAAKGFGKTKPSRKDVSDDESDVPGSSRRKGRNLKLRQSDMGPIPGQERPGQSSQFQTQLLAPDQLSEEEDDFMKRLEVLKEQGRELKSAASTPADPLDILNQPVSQPAIFETREDIYANPPPLTKTLMGTTGSDISDPKLRDAAIGPSQLGLAAGAIVFVVIFLIVAAGDYAPASKRYSGVRPAQAPPDPIQEKILKGKVALYEDQLKANPNDEGAAEALANAYAGLLQYDKAADMLEKLTKNSPSDPEAWRLLGESALLSQQPRRAVPALERAVELRRAQAAPGPGGALTQPDLQLLTGLTDAYIANGDFPRAVDTLTGLRAAIQAASAAAAQAAAAAAEAPAPAPAPAAEEAAAAVSAASDSSAGDAAEPEASTTAPSAAAVLTQPPPMRPAPSLTDAPSASDPSTSAPVPPSQARPLDPVGVELLTAKVYSAWRGHDNDALATYDGLIKAFPEDYRGYLAKGVFLKEKGRKADAERMFLQARFYAPAGRQQLVRAIADSTPALTLPDNN